MMTKTISACLGGLRSACMLGALAATAFGAPVAQAQQYPDRAITMIVPVGPGGGTDIMAREISRRLSEAWGKPIVVENKPGGAGAVGVKSMMRVPADGYTLMFTHDGIIVATPKLFKAPGYDPRTDLIGISEVAKTGYLLVVHPSVPARSVTELIALMRDKKARNESFGFATSAVGSADHLSGEMFRQMTQVDMLVVHYKGTTPAMADVIGGHLPFGFFAIPPTTQHVESGSLRALGVTTRNRLPLLPDVAAIGESVPGFESSSWYGLFALAGTPRPIVEKISAEVRRIVGAPDFIDYMNRIGFIGVGSTPAEFADFIAKDTEKVGEIIRAANVRAE